MQRLAESDEVEVLHDDGWWVMTFMGTRPGDDGGIEYHVASALYHVERWVGADHVRPRWKRWGTKWRPLEQLRKPPAQPKGSPVAATTKPAPSKPKASPTTAAKPTASAAAGPPPSSGGGGRKRQQGAGWSERSVARAAATNRAAAAGGSVPPAVIPPAIGALPATKRPALPYLYNTLRTSSVAAAPPPPSLPAMSASTKVRCTDLLREMATMEGAVWFAEPVRVRTHTRTHARTHMNTYAHIAHRRTHAHTCARTHSLTCGEPSDGDETARASTRRHARRRVYLRVPVLWPMPVHGQVDVAQVPDYLCVVAQPMDYATVGTKLRGGGYDGGPLSFAADMRLIYTNALRYDGDAEPRPSLL